LITSSDAARVYRLTDALLASTERTQRVIPTHAAVFSLERAWGFSATKKARAMPGFSPEPFSNQVHLTPVPWPPPALRIPSLDLAEHMRRGIHA
jgi:hypothetical protein